MSDPAAASPPAATPPRKLASPRKLPPKVPSKATAPPVDENSIEEQMRRLLLKHDPKIAPGVSQMLQKNPGKEQALLNQMIKRYGEVPPPDDPDVVAARAKMPARRPTPKAAATPAASSGDAAAGAPTTGAGAAAASGGGGAEDAAEIRRQCEALFRKNDPKMVPAVPKMLQKYPPGQEHILRDQLVKRWGPVPADGDGASSPGPSAPAKKAPPVPSKRPGGSPAPAAASSSPSQPQPPQQQQQQQQQKKKPLAPEEEARLIIKNFEPNMLPQLDSMTERFKTKPGGVAAFVLMLRKKHKLDGPYFGPEGTAAAASPQQQPAAAAAATAAQPLGPEDEVRAILAHYEPKMASKGDDMINTFRAKPGGVGALVIMLRKRHKIDGPFVPPSAAAATTSSSSSSSHSLQPLGPAPAASAPLDKAYWRARLSNFYSVYDKDKLGTLDDIIGEYERGGNKKFADMFQFLVQKYGPEPAAPSPLAVAAAAADSTPTAGAGPQPDSDAAAAATGATATTQPQLEDMIPDEEKPELQHLRLKRYYAKHDPSRIPTAGAILAKYGGDAAGVKDLFKSLVAKYGPEPDATDASMPIVDRCVNIYLYYDPAEIINLNRHLDVFRKDQAQLTGGKGPTNMVKVAESLLAQLQNKYGPEPTPLQLQEMDERIKSEHQPDEHGVVVASLNAVQHRCYRMLKHYDRPKLAHFKAEQKKYAGHEHDWLALLLRTHGPEPEEKKSKEEKAAVAKRMQEMEQAEKGKSEFEVRCRNMLHKYDPKQLEDGTFHELVERYGGGAKGAEKLLQDLVSRYGEEPDLRAADDREHLQQRAANVINTYDPEAAAQLPGLLQRFAGREDTLVRSLVRRYGPEPLDQLGEISGGGGKGGAAIPPTLGENISEIQALIRKHEPDSLAAAPGLLKRYAGKEELLLQLLQQRYGVSIGIELTAPEEAQRHDARISGSLADIENQVRALLAKHQPEAVEKIPELMQEHVGKERQLLDDLVAKHGPVTEEMLKSIDKKKQQGEAAAGGGGDDETSTSSSVPFTNRPQLHPHEAKYRQKLTAFFTHYDRMQLPRIDEWFDNYPGRPEAMLEAVHKKYAVPAPKEVPEWVPPLQQLCLHMGQDELFLERLITAMGGNNASKENVTFELLSIWFPDFVQSIMTDEGQRRTLTAKRLARFLSVMAPGKVQDVPEMLAQVPAEQDSTVVLGDMLLTFFKDAVQSAAIPRLDYAALRITEREHGAGAAAVGAGFIGTVERLQKMLDVWHTQRHHIRTPEKLGDAALDLIRLSKVSHRAAGPDELIDKPVRTQGTDTELDVESVFGSATPAGGKTVSERDDSQRQHDKLLGKDNIPPPPPNPLLFSRFGIDQDTIPRTRWGCPSCGELKNFVLGSETRWQQQLRDAELKIWKLMEQNAKMESAAAHPASASASASNQSQQQQTPSNADESASTSSHCQQCNKLQAELEQLHKRVHNLQVHTDAHQKQMSVRNAAAETSGIRAMFQREYPSPAAAQASARATVNFSVNNSSSSNNNNSTASAAAAASPATSGTGNRQFAFYSTAPTQSRISPALQRSAELWSSLYTQPGAGSTGHSVANRSDVAAGITVPTSDAAQKMLSFL